MMEGSADLTSYTQGETCMPHPQDPVHSLSVSFDEVSDESLLRALADGAVWAMEPLYHRYHRLLYVVAYQMVRDPQVAENLLQEVFFAVWRRATLYSPQLGSVRTWLLSIMRHRIID